MSADNSTYQVLVDSDAFVGYFNERDAHHEKATQMFADLERRRVPLVTTNYVIAETATVLSNRRGQALARAFLKLMKRFPTIHIDERMQQESLELFERQTQRGTSAVDCSNIVVMRRFGIPKLLSFDKFYFNRMGLKAA